MDRIDFSAIPAAYRPVPFWSWNDLLDPAELRRQIRLMHRAGIGGFFMHARGGLRTAYLSEAWMECVNACLDEAGKLGMEAWLYDENGWPSGFGGGLVNGKGERFQQKFLKLEELSPASARAAAGALAFYRRDGSFLGRALPDRVRGRVLVCRYEVNPYYVDNLDPEVVGEFIRVTHEFYDHAIPEGLRGRLRGIFTDEPQLMRDGIPWSPVLEVEYRKAYARKLLPELPALFRDLPGCAAVRVRFWKLVTRLFSENFLKQIHDWCAAHHWLLTGHHLLEETCQHQLPCNGAIMPQYRYYDMPGVDHLGRGEPSAVSQTQVVSTAAQCGIKPVLTESFAMTGWNFNFSGMRWLFQTQLVRGVSRLCQHLQGYTLRGLRKRDYPGSFFYHQPWWEDYARINDFFAFAGMVLAENPAEVRVLVVHPISSAWMHYRGDWTAKELDFYTQTLVRTTGRLDELLVAHHYADEQLAEDCGRVEKGRLILGRGEYTCVIIPMIANISAPLAALLRKFAAAGGRVLMVRNRLEPEILRRDGEPMPPDLAEFFRGLPQFDSEAAAAEAAAASDPDRVRIAENGVPTTRMLATWRSVADCAGRRGRFHLIVSRQYRNSAFVRISLPATGRAVEFIDAVTGEIHPVAGAERRDGRWEFDWHFAAGDGAMFLVSDAPGRGTAVGRPDFERMPTVKKLSDRFTVAGMDANILTLDRCRFRVDGGAWRRDDVIQLQTHLTRLRRECEVEVEYRFTLAADFPPDTPLTLVTETPEQYTFALNGREFPGTDAGAFFDSAFRRIALPPALRTGENRLVMRMRYAQHPGFYEQLERAKKFETEYNKLTFDTEIESVYLIGDFSVKHDGRREDLPRLAVRYRGNFSLGPTPVHTEVDGSDLVGSGMPFFSGKTRLVQRFRLSPAEVAAAAFLRFTPLGANSCRVALNGRELGPFFWGPYAAPVAGILREGENVLEVELTTSLRNMLGPHHLAEGESYAVHTMSFNRDASAVGYRPPPYDPGYCFVRLGFADAELIGPSPR